MGRYGLLHVGMVAVRAWRTMTAQQTHYGIPFWLLALRAI